MCMAHGQGGAEIATERSPTLTCNHEAPIAFQPVLSVHGTQDPDIRVEHAHTLGRNNGQENAVLAFSCKDYGADAGDLSPTLRAMGHSGSHANAGGQVAVTYPLLEVGKRTGTSTSDPRAGIGIGDESDPMFTLQASAQHGVAYGIPGNWIGRKPENGGNAVEPMHDVAPCLTTADRHGVAYKMAVRRLTPKECERLQGFPDGHTDVPVRGKAAADGPRYKALGNSKAVPVVRWIGRRLQQELRRVDRQ